MNAANTGTQSSSSVASSGSSAVVVPTTFAACIAPAFIAYLEEKLAPPPAQRGSGAFEFEVEVEGEGTFTLAYKNRLITAKKGFCKNDPLVSVYIPRSGFPLLRTELQLALDGFPQNPSLQKGLTFAKNLKTADLDDIAARVEKLKPMRLVFDVKNHGQYKVARGPMDEATREMVIQLDGDVLLSYVSGSAGSDLTALAQKIRQTTSIKGQTALGSELAATFATLLQRFRSA